MRAARIVVVLVLAVALLAAIDPDEPSARVRPFDRVAVLFLENHGYDQIIGSQQAPYLNRLARRGALATQYYAVGAPVGAELPRAHDRLDARRDERLQLVRRVRPVTGRSLDAAHISWRAYFESIPARGYDGRGAGTYTKHYNPFAYSERSGDAVGRRHVLGFGSLRHDLRRGTLPRFSWIAPNLAHDGHNGSVRASDRFAARLVPRIERALGPDGVLFVTWDEAQGVTGPAGGRVALIATGPGARRAVRSNAPADHYSLLATLESGLGLPLMGNAADAPVAPVTALLRG